MRTKRYSDKKGISLIVLVITIIVIIILAVAVILSIANNNPIENAKEARFKSDIKTIEEDLNMYTLKKYADRDIKGIEEVNLSGDDMVGALPSTKNYKEKLEVKNGTLYIKSGGALTQDEQEWAKEVGVEKTPITFTKKGELEIGSEVEASNGEQFYVIGGDTVGTMSASAQDILLLAKYNLKEENGNLMQGENGATNPCVFSSTNYWNNVDGIAYPDANGKYPDLNDVEKYPLGSATSIIIKAKLYGEILGVSGRLMTVEEVVELGGSTSDISTSGCPTYINTQNYWLGSADHTNIVWIVFGEKSFLNVSFFDNAKLYGIRPVIEVPIDSIK